MPESQCSHCKQPFTPHGNAEGSCPACRQALELERWQTEGAVEPLPSPPAD